MLLAAGCGSGDCDKTATACPYQMYGTASGNCLLDTGSASVWKECPDPHSICQNAACNPNPTGSCRYGGSQAPSKYCCGSSTSVGSLDCPDNQFYSGQLGLFCGMTCQAPGSACCNGGSCGAIGGVCVQAPSCSGNQQAAPCPDGTRKCCSVNQVCCHDSANGGAIGCEFSGFCQ
ncbi:MAG: hypothetical protein ACXWLM_09450 [Myxococcales bacterium]